ncbi:chemotaxis protein CheW [Synechococcus elongatus]|uniref:chemotaxis protein CheW n=1 Tax=Synechococcus elongatus TaxID=32046 RepID=UPI000039FF89|nr:chemotaxis protein CheW [Synechococcus elongatus]
MSDTTIAVIPTVEAQEVVMVTHQQLTLMPNMPGTILGLLNHRNRVIWVIDLPQLLGLPMLMLDLRQYAVVVIQVAGQLLGLAIQQIEGLSRLNPSDIQSPVGSVDASLVPFLRGCYLQDQELLLVLDAAAIAHAKSLQPHAI